jgi:large subunit ribosomal protein L21
MAARFVNGFRTLANVSYSKTSIPCNLSTKIQHFAPLLNNSMMTMSMRTMSTNSHEVDAENSGSSPALDLSPISHTSARWGETLGHSIVHHPISINGEPLDASLPTPKDERFAIVELSGTQYKVVIGDTIVADHIEGIDIDDKIDYNDVLLIGSRKATIVGRPYVPNTKVILSVEELTRDKKVYIFKTRRRKASRRLRGFRKRVTILRVEDIICSDEDQNAL